MSSVGGVQADEFKSDEFRSDELRRMRLFSSEFRSDEFRSNEFRHSPWISSRDQSRKVYVSVGERWRSELA